MTRGSVIDSHVRFQRVITDENADLSPQYGAFTCQYPGMYYFSFSAVATEHTPLKVSLRRNRVPLATILSSGKIGQTVTGSLLLELAEDDVVYPFVEAGTLRESGLSSRALTSFSGFRIVSENGLNATARIAPGQRQSRMRLYDAFID